MTKAKFAYMKKFNNLLKKLKKDKLNYAGYSCILEVTKECAGLFQLIINRECIKLLSKILLFINFRHQPNRF